MCKIKRTDHDNSLDLKIFDLMWWKRWKRVFRQIPQTWNSTLTCLQLFQIPHAMLEILIPIFTIPINQVLILNPITMHTTHLMSLELKLWLPFGTLSSCCCDHTIVVQILIARIDFDSNILSYHSHNQFSTKESFKLLIYFPAFTIFFSESVSREYIIHNE